MLHLVVMSPIRKEKKRNINNNLAILPSHDSYVVLTMATRIRGKKTINIRLQKSEGELDNTHPYQVT